MTNIEKAIVAALLLIAAFGAYVFFEEATYDYTVCEASGEWRAQYSPPWMQSIHNGKTTTFVHHPARRWMEQLYYCPEEERWREEQPQATNFTE